MTVFGFRRWTVPGQKRRNHAEAWSRISCFVTAIGNGPQLSEELLKKQRGDAGRLWGERYLDTFLGEHGWRDTQSIKLENNLSSGIYMPYTGIVESLSVEGNSKDNSVDKGFSLFLPSSGAIKMLDLHLRSGKAPEYVDSNDILRWQDPSLYFPGSGAALVSREYFLEKLASVGLEPVWVLAGEKNVYGGQGFGASSNGFGGRLSHTTVFAIDGGVLKSFGTRTNFHEPVAVQLKKLKAQ